MNYLKLVNKDHDLSDQEIEEVEQSSDLVKVVDNCGHDFDYGYEIKLEMLTYEAYKKLQKAMQEKFGVNTFVRSGFRNKKAQEDAVIEVAATKYGGDMEKAQEVTAAPGQSEHHTGLAVDVNFDLKESFLDKVVRKLGSANAKKKNLPYVAKIDKRREVYYKNMASICTDFGFILRFPEGKKDGNFGTGYDYEPWHLRFVGSAEMAKAISAAGTMEKYISDMEKKAERPVEQQKEIPQEKTDVKVSKEMDREL